MIPSKYHKSKFDINKLKRLAIIKTQLFYGFDDDV